MYLLIIILYTMLLILLLVLLSHWFLPLKRLETTQSPIGETPLDLDFKSTWNLNMDEILDDFREILLIFLDIQW